MRLIKLTVILLLLIALQTSCIRTKKSDADAKLIESMEGPRVIRDTIIQVVLRDTIDSKNGMLSEKEPVPTAKSNRGTTYRDRDNDYDPNNSAFFDQYRNNYAGDPNQGISNTPTKRTVKTNTEDIERKKEVIERSLDMLEQKNQQEQQRYDQLEKEREAFNKKSVQDANAQKQTPKKQEPKSKTLDTNLLLKK